MPSLPQHLVILKNLNAVAPSRRVLGVSRKSAPPVRSSFSYEGRVSFGVSLLGSIPRWMISLYLRQENLGRLVHPAGLAHSQRPQFTWRRSVQTGVPSQPRTAGSCDQHTQLPGLSRFLHPSLFPDHQRAASRGPVIVNAIKYGCDDALIILLNRDPVHIPLPITEEGVQDLSMELCPQSDIT